jgi:hypothetical protein
LINKYLLELQLREIIGGRKETKKELLGNTKHQICQQSSMNSDETMTSAACQEIQKRPDTPEYVPLKYLQDQRDFRSPSCSIDYKQGVISSQQLQSQSEQNFKPVEPAANFSASLPHPLEVTEMLGSGNVIINDTLRKLDDRHINEMEIIQKRMEELQRNYMQEKEDLRVDLVTSLETANSCNQQYTEDNQQQLCKEQIPVNYAMHAEHIQVSSNGQNNMSLNHQHQYFHPQQQTIPQQTYISQGDRQQKNEHITIQTQ